MNLSDSVLESCKLLVRHFQLCLEREMNGLPKGFHSRVFEKFLHPEEKFVAYGKSEAVISGEPSHPEHLVPCAFMYSECCRLLEEGKSIDYISTLLAKHWKISRISKDEAHYLDTKNGLSLKDTMPDGWCFETGKTTARIDLAKIDLVFE